MPLPNIAVLLPCRNEAAAIADVVAGFRGAMPGARIYVYDNESEDETAAIAKAAGAIVRTEGRPGKGNVVRRMFADVEADIYIMADGDDTYETQRAPEMVDLLLRDNLDMVVGCRTTVESAAAYRTGHVLGNAALNWLFAAVFGWRVADMLSGYRVLSRRMVKSFPTAEAGFGIETELTVHCFQLRMPIAEVETHYRARPDGSESKLNTWRDGIRILWTTLSLLRHVRPLLFFSVAGLMLAVLALALGIPLVATYMETGLVPRLPTAMIVTAIMMLSFLSLACGLVLESVSRGRLEAKRMAYLRYAAPRQSIPDAD
ncbi:MAG: glycosyltransferase [Alphaproteobacteria bacterium]|nr:glycosyltransferase [Alphaproteobacteria bacterium]